jgi:hypothetical protein
MIKGLMGSDGVFVEGGNNSLPYHNPNSNDSFSGLLRLCGTDIQYYSNGAWNNLPTSYATVRMDSNIVNWVRDKQAKEASDKAARDYMKNRARDFPALQKALEAIERAEESRDTEVKRAIENFHILDKVAGDKNEFVDSPPPMQAP